MIRRVVATTTKHSLGHLRELLATRMIVIVPFIMAVVVLLLSAATFVVVAAAVVLATAMVWFVGVRMAPTTTRTPVMMFRRLRHFYAIDSRAFFSQNSGYDKKKRERERKKDIVSKCKDVLVLLQPSIHRISSRNPQKMIPTRRGETAPPHHLLPWERNEPTHANNTTGAQGNRVEGQREEWKASVGS
jgi:hypothetical protein